MAGGKIGKCMLLMGIVVIAIQASMRLLPQCWVIVSSSRRRVAVAMAFSHEDFADDIVGFGMHAELTYAELIEQYPGYIDFLRSCDDPSEKVRQVIEYAQERESVEPREQNMGRQTVGFGKHRDLTVDELYEQQFEYVCWMRGLDEPSSWQQSILQYYESMTPRDELRHLSTQRLGFGKHSELTLEELYNSKPDYIDWLRSLPDPRPVVKMIFRYGDLLAGSSSKRVIVDIPCVSLAGEEVAR